MMRVLSEHSMLKFSAYLSYNIYASGIYYLNNNGELYRTMLTKWDAEL